MEERVDDEDAASSKLLVKNLAFEVTAKDLRALCAMHGAVKKVRLPKKFDGTTHRGFGFVEFVSLEEAKNAFRELSMSHLHGRKLVIQWAKKEAESLEALQEQAVKQLSLSSC